MPVKNSIRFARALMLVPACLSFLLARMPDTHAAATDLPLALTLRCANVGLKLGDEIPRIMR